MTENKGLSQYSSKPEGAAAHFRQKEDIVGAIKVFLKEVLLPIALAFCLASFLKPIYMPDGVCDYFLMWICVGLPFGIRRMCLWLVPSGYGISGSVGIFALNLIIGGLIGGLAFFIGLLLGVIHTIREII